MMLERITNWLRRLWPVVSEEERAIRRELMFHVDRLSEDFRSKGMTRRAARREALKRFGKVGHVEQAVVEANGVREISYRGDNTMKGMLFDLQQDIRYGLRTLRKSPGFTAVAVITLALGIGANTAIFSVVNSILLRPLPYEDQERIVALWESHDGTPNSIAVPNFLDWQDRNSVFEQLTLYRSRNFVLTGHGEPQQVRTTTASGNLFQLLGVEAQLGRVFTPADDSNQAERVAVLSDGLFQQLSGGDPNFLGRRLQLSGESFTVIGVMRASFRFPEDEEARIWIPISFDGQFDFGRDRRSAHSFSAIGRIRKHVTLGQARAEMETIGANLAAEYPRSNEGESVLVRPYREELVGEVLPALLVLSGAVAMVLLIACINVASLLMVRAIARHREVAIRTALGARRGRLIRQILAETLLLALMGGWAGLGLAWVAIKVLPLFGPQEVPLLDQVSLDLPVLAFTLSVCVLAGVFSSLGLFGRAFASNPVHVLRDAARSSSPVLSRRIRGFLVVAEVGLSLVLLVSAGLLLRSFQKVLNVHPGFNPENVLTFRLSLPESKYPAGPDYVTFYSSLLEKLQSVPGVRSTGLATPLPMSGASMGTSIAAEGSANSPGEEGAARFRMVSPDYFKTLGIRVERGRIFTRADLTGGGPFVVVNNSLVRRFWPGENVLGKRLRMGTLQRGTPWATVIGVVEDVRYRGLESTTQPEMYYPYSTFPMNWVFVVVKTTSDDPMSLLGAVTAQVHALDEDQPVFAVHTMKQLVARSIAERRFLLALTGGFSLLALALTAIGIYGVIAQTVVQRTHEMAIRTALGAQASRILWLILRQGMGLTFLGAMVGIAAGVYITRYLSSLLFGVDPLDTITFLVSGLVLLLSALLAILVPARRATRVDPLVVLRYE